MFFSDGDGVSSRMHRCSCEKLSGSNASSTFCSSNPHASYLPRELKLLQRRFAEREGGDLQPGVVRRVEAGAPAGQEDLPQRVEVGHHGERTVDRDVRVFLR